MWTATLNKPQEEEEGEKGGGGGEGEDNQVNIARYIWNF
jgi:hypothetical protein